MIETYRVALTLGHVELKQFNKFENGRLRAYGYAIEYDQNGKEVGRTKPEAFGSIGWDNDEPFTEEDYWGVK